MLGWLKKLGERRKKQKVQNELLIEATKMSDIESVKKCLDLGANPNNAYNEEGFSPLHIAVIREDLAIIEALLKAKAIISIKKRGEGTGKEPLHVAAIRGNQNVIEALLTAGAGIDRRCSDGCTALMHAAQNGHGGAVALLVAAGANRNIGMPFAGKSATPAQVARIFKHNEIADFLDSIT